MKRMHKMALPLTLGFALTAGIASAQAMGFSQIDTDGDDVLTMGELEMAFGAQAETALNMYDMNDDGMVAMSEAADAQTRMQMGGQANMMEDEDAVSMEASNSVGGGMMEDDNMDNSMN